MFCKNSSNKSKVSWISASYNNISVRMLSIWGCQNKKTTVWWSFYFESAAPTGYARVPTLARMHHTKTQFSWATPTGTPKNTQHFLSSANMARHCGRHCAGNQYCRRYRNQVPSQPCIAPKHTNVHQPNKTNPTPQEQCKIPKNKVFYPMICRHAF